MPKRVNSERSALLLVKLGLGVEGLERTLDVTNTNHQLKSA